MSTFVHRHGLLRRLWPRRALVFGSQADCDAFVERAPRFRVVGRPDQAANLVQLIGRRDIDTLVLLDGADPPAVASLPATVPVELLVGRAGSLRRLAVPPIHGLAADLKRTLDVLAATILFLLLSPVLLLIACAIKLDSPGPVIFRQKRYGLNRQVFPLWKFRTMEAAAADLDATVQTSRRDARLTRVGAVLRRHSLDELPQLLNVLAGHMSIVGPRPHALGTSTEGKLLEDALPRYITRLRVMPGITGWAQVNGSRGELSTLARLEERVDYDLYYIDNWSFLLDLGILLRTIRCIVHDRGAY